MDFQQVLKQIYDKAPLQKKKLERYLVKNPIFSLRKQINSFQIILVI